MKELQELTSKIRKAIPRLMEIKAGCLITTKERNEKYFLVTTNNHPSHDMATIDNEKFCIIDYFDAWGSSNTLTFDTIIGHEPMLNDVLEWLIKVEPRTYMRYSIDKDFFINGQKIDLSKPYLKDWDAELIKYLNEL